MDTSQGDCLLLLTEEIDIEHARNGGEKRVGKYSLDGFCEERNTAYEFQGCFWHGKYYGASLRCIFLSNFLFFLQVVLLVTLTERR